MKPEKVREVLDTLLDYADSGNEDCDLLPEQKEALSQVIVLIDRNKELEEREISIEKMDTQIQSQAEVINHLQSQLQKQPSVEEIEKVRNSLMYDFPKHYSSHLIMAYQRGLTNLAQQLHNLWGGK